MITQHPASKKKLECEYLIEYLNKKELGVFMKECHSNNEKCCCPCHHKKEESCQQGEEHEEMLGFLIETADCAWSEVLKDKIKEYILSTQNDRMTELAKIVAEANSQRWRHKMEKKHGIKDFKEKLCRFFGHSK
jgi:hypothetical protein